jgi:hypothetical protein
MMLLLLACMVPMILPSHHAIELLEAPIGAEGQTSFAGRSVHVSFGGDHSLAPVGAMFDDLNAAINPVQQTYLMSQPGLALFEALSSAIERGGGSVSRDYGWSMAPTPEGATLVVVEVDEMELHRWRTESGDVLLARAKVSWTIGGVVSSNVATARVAAQDDAVAALANQLALSLARRMP